MANDSLTFAAKPGRAAGKAYIHYAMGHTTLVKPLIVAEGYDKHFIAPHISQFNYSIDQFIFDTQTAGNFDFDNALEKVGKYDIVFIDYANGTDDILLNAGLFGAVLDSVNVLKGPAPTEDNVVMGMSMGGLIARYKLAEREKASPGSTHVRLLILQDSPQRGANVPLGISAFVRQLGASFLGNIIPTLQEANALLDQTGTRQLLKYQALGPESGSSFENTFIDGQYSQMVPYKIVAVSQGSQCAVGQFQPYTELLRANGALNLLGAPSGIPLTGLRGDIVVNALPNAGLSNRVAGTHIYTQVLILPYFYIRRDIINYNFDCPAGLLYTIDGGGGSTEEIPDASASKGSGWLPFAAKLALVPRFCFLPTASALDIQDYNLNSISGTYINSIASVSVSRTDGFIAQQQNGQGSSATYNQPHLTFTARNGEFMFDIMERIPLASNYCSTDCTSPNKPFVGASTLCGGNNSPATYTSPIQGPGVTYAWTASPCNLFTVCSGTGPTFQTANASNSGTGTITLTVTTPCTQRSYTQAVTIGAPAPPSLQEDPSQSNYCLRKAAFIITNYDPALQYTVNGGTAVSATGRFSVRGPAFQVFTLTVANSCGTVSRTDTLTYTPCSQRTYDTYPNPADDDLTIAQTDSSTVRSPAARGGTASAANTAPSTPYTVRLYDNYGVQQLLQSTTTPTVQLPTSGLPTGLYLLHIIEASGTIVERRRVQITH